MKIAILGGSFNPPHWGHLLVAYQVLGFTSTNLVWLTPCFQHTFNKELAPVNQRVAMTKILTNSKIKLCLEEVKNKLSGKTIELMALLEKKYPQHQFSFIIGSDNLASFKKWASWEKLVKKWKFLVFPRPDFNPGLAKYGLDRPQYRFEVIKNSLLVTSDISSSNIRERTKKDISINSLVPKEVKEYIKINGIYV